jgi:hypothetical protein
MTPQERKRRELRKDSYHLVASRNRLPSDPEEEEEDMLFRYQLSPPSSQDLLQTKAELLRALARSGGDVTTPDFERALQLLTGLNDPPVDVRKRVKPPCSSSSRRKKQSPPSLEGMWIEISKPKFRDCLGLNANRDYKYSLGRMSFDMFRPTSLVCSIQGSFNPVHEVKEVQDVNLPENLLEEFHGGKGVLRTYE